MNGDNDLQHPARLVVLDTNVLLDWLVFRNPVGNALESALQAGRLRWVATTTMRDEMAHVLARGIGGRWAVDEAHWRAAWARHATLVDMAEAPLSTPCCTDADDQKFIDLAVVARAGWLLTRDRAVLRLRRRLAAHGVAVMTPERWGETEAFTARP